MHEHRRAATVAAFALAAAAVAQNQSRGMFPGIQTAVTVAGGGMSPMQLFMKGPGFQTAAPSVDPGFDLHAVLVAHGAPAGLAVDDISLGLDWVLADDQTGRVQVPATQWAAITFSVTAASAGAPGSRIASEAATPGGAGADVFSYVLPGSALPTPFVGAVERANDSRELGLGAAPPEVVGLDHFLPMYQLEPGLVAMLPSLPTVFFTVPSSSVLQVPSNWWAATPASAAAIRSGATILQTTRRSGTWSLPQPFMTWRDLGLLQSDDVDGLAIDLEDQRILFSLRQPSSRNQLLFLYYGTDLGGPVTYATQTGTPVATAIGAVQGDDVDAICSMDPSIRSHGAQPNPFFFCMGYAAPPVLPPQPAISATAFRDYANGNTVYMTYMVGYPPLTGPGPGVAALFLTFGNTLSPVYQLGPVLLRSGTPLFVGDPKRFGLVVPPALNLSLHAIPLAFRWFAADAAFSELAEAWPVHVTL